MRQPREMHKKASRSNRVVREAENRICATTTQDRAQNFSGGPLPRQIDDV